MNEILLHGAGVGASLAIGLVIGLERGWSGRERSEGSRVAGLRTFALTGLLGGLLGILPKEFGPWPLLGGLLGISILMAVSYREAAKVSGDLSVTSAIAMLLTFVLGGLAAAGAINLALSVAVIVAVLLAMKPTLHRGLQLLESRELSAALQMLVLSVVILPNLPNAGYGPYQALNPYQLWWAVVLIAGLSLAGHLAMRITDSRRGILWTGIIGGVASSTAATVTLSRYARQQPSLAQAAAAGVLAASGVMFLRMAILLVLIQPALLKSFGLSTILAGVALLALALWQWRGIAKLAQEDGQPEAMAPFELGTALSFGVFLALIAVLVPAAKEWLGATGIYALSALSGLADVDAIIISLAQSFGQGGLLVTTTVVALSLAVLTNMISKASIAWVTGGKVLGWIVLRGYVIGMSVAAVALFLA